MLMPILAMIWLVSLVNTSEPLDVPHDEWQYMNDKNENDLPDFFEDMENWSNLKDTDEDGLPNCIEVDIGSDLNLIDSDSDGLDDYYEVFVTYTDPTFADSDENGVNDGDEDFDNDNLTNHDEYISKSNPHCNEQITGLVLEKTDESVIAESDPQTSISLFANDKYVRLFGIWQFDNETEDIEDDIESYFGSSDTKCQNLTTDQESSFVRAWNNAADSGKEYEVCVVNCHANPTSMYNGLTTADIKKLKTVDCKCLILLGCNAGHYDYIWNNVAYEFSKKVTGVVVARMVQYTQVLQIGLA